jgi:hypothetical protein
MGSNTHSNISPVARGFSFVKRNEILTCNERVRFEVFTAVTMKNVVFWDATPCGSCKNRCFGGIYISVVGKVYDY